MAKSRLKQKKIHPWRLCPWGQHWVRTHPMKVKPSRKNPLGYTTTRHAHCALNPSGKDQLYPDEILEITAKSLHKAKTKPCPKNLKFRSRGNKYDDLIAGWTKYWNDIFGPADPLDPNLVKALIASESEFDPKALANKKNSNSARGLMQITNSTRKILADEKGELRDHFLTLSKEDLNDPSINICAGVRWLFHKRNLASNKLKRPATWKDAVAEFKALSTVPPKRASELLKRFTNLFEELKICEK